MHFHSPLQLRPPLQILLELSDACSHIDLLEVRAATLHLCASEDEREPRMQAAGVFAHVYIIFILDN